MDNGKLTSPFASLPKAPDYEVTPLAYDEIGVAAVQMNPQPVDSGNPQKGIKANLDHMLYMCDAACVWPPDPSGLKLIVFPEFTLTGFDSAWTRKEWLRIAICVPRGPEIERIGQKAKELGIYIAFASHTQDPDEWPGHFFNNSVIVGPQGTVIHTHWKAYTGFPGTLEYSTTVHDVLEEFVERYGWKAVWPVTRTEIGNLATFTCSEGHAPETARVLAINGAEILIRHTANGGAYRYLEFPRSGNTTLRMRSDCTANHVWGVYADSQANQITVSGVKMFENGLGGGTMIVDPYGRVMQKAGDSLEQILRSTIPIASFRKKHTVPKIRNELYLPAFADNPGYCPPNLYSAYLPEDREDALRHSINAMKRRDAE